MEYLPRLGLIGTITIVLAITTKRLAVPRVWRSAAPQPHPGWTKNIRVRPRAIAVPATVNPLIGPRRIPVIREIAIPMLRDRSRDRDRNRNQCTDGRAWPKIAVYAPFVSTKHNPPWRQPLSLSTDWSIASVPSISRSIHRPNLSLQLCELADPRCPHTALRMRRMGGYESVLIRRGQADSSLAHRAEKNMLFSVPRKLLRPGRASTLCVSSRLFLFASGISAS